MGLRRNREGCARNSGPRPRNDEQLGQRRDNLVGDAARSEATRRWPAKAALIARVKDDGRAEAALIALAGFVRESRR
jgi:hypothetical protein